MTEGLNSSINHRLAITTGLMRRMIFRIISKKNVNITPDQWSILKCLWGNEKLTIKEIVTKSKKDFSNVTRMIEKLEKIGYIEKTKNEKDARSYVISVTEKAIDIRPQIEECWRSSLDITLKGIAENEQRLFMDVLLRIEKNILEYLGETESLIEEDTVS